MATIPLDTGLTFLSTTGTTAIVSGTISARAGDILVVAAADIGGGSTPSTLTVTDSFANVGTWTTVRNESFVNGTWPYSGRTIIAWAPVTGSGSGTVTVTPNVSRDHDMFLRVFRLTGRDTTNPVGLNVGSNGTGLGTSHTTSMGGTPAATSHVISALFVDATTADDDAEEAS